MNILRGSKVFGPILFLVISTVAAYKGQCGKAYLVDTGKKPSFQQAAKPDLSCKWELIGTRACEVEVTCTVDLPKADQDCGENYLLISDGYAGAKKICGSDTFTLRASQGLRDLFVVLMTSEDIPSNHKGVQCTAKCAGGGAGTRLAKDWTRKVDQRCVCGLRNEDDRIVGGVDAKFNEFPWLAAIVDKGTRRPFCGGALINDRFILTAAHCFYFAQKVPEDIDVLLHAHTLDMTIMAKADKNAPLGKEGSIRGPGWDAAIKTDADEKTIRLEVEEIINHQLFTEAYNFDYALLKLKKKVDLADSELTPVCIPPATTYDEFSLEKKELTVAGWGLADEKAQASTRVLQKLDVPFIKWKQCKVFFPKYLTDRMLCAGFLEGIKDACSGDSGGPLVHQLPNKQFWQMGIVSWGDGCARAKKPGVYSQVTEMAQWIHFHTADHDAKWCKDSK